MPNPDMIIPLVGANKTYQLYVGMKALRTFETHTGKSLMQIFDTKEITFEDLTKFAHCSLLQFHPELTMDDCDEIIDEIGLDKVLSTLMLALERAFANIKNLQTPNGVTPVGAIP